MFDECYAASQALYDSRRLDNDDFGLRIKHSRINVIRKSTGRGDCIKTSFNFTS